MYAGPVHPDGLGFPPFLALLPLIITAGAGVAGTLLAAKIAAGAGPKQADIEEQIRLQHQLEIQRMLQEQQNLERTTSMLLPAAGVLALVMLLR